MIRLDLLPQGSCRKNTERKNKNKARTETQATLLSSSHNQTETKQTNKMVSSLYQVDDALARSSIHSRGAKPGESHAVTFSLRDALLREDRQRPRPTPPQVVRRPGQPSEFKLKLLEACYLQGSVALWDPHALDFDETRKTNPNQSSSEEAPRPRRCCC